MLARDRRTAAFVALSTMVYAFLTFFAFQEFPSGTSPLLEILKALVFLSGLGGVWALARVGAQAPVAQSDSLMATAKFAALGEMAAGMAHEINTPLGAITLSASQLKDLIPAQAEHRDLMLEIVEDVLGASEKISRIVRGLRSFSRGGGQGADSVFCNLATLLDESVAICESSLRKSGIELRMDKLPSNLDLQCNPSQISQVIVNLLNNARDALVPLSEKWIELKVVASPESIEVRITDSGAGVAREAKEKLFQPFFTTKPVGQGTGLGLSIARNILEAHGGEILLDTNHPHTSFVVRLPRFQVA